MNTALRPLPTLGLTALGLLVTLPSPTEACTSMLLPSKDGGYVYTRTMEFTLQMQSQIMILPRGQKVVCTGTDGVTGKGGLTWTAKYAAAGANALGLPVIIDGLNEKGLSGGLFNFPGYAEFQKVPKDAGARSMASHEVVTWVLGNFATVAEVKDGIRKVYVSGTRLKQFGNNVPPVHYSFHDAQGNSVAIEYVKGELHVYDNPTHVFTNAPDFPYQLANLSQYQYISPNILPPIQAGKMTLAAASSGAGLNGLPGGYLAPARFVRAFFAQQFAPVQATSDQSVTAALRLMAGFELPTGSIRTSATGGGEGGGVSGNETTEWTSASDMKALRYYIRTYDNPDVRYVDLRKAAPTAKSIQFVPLNQPQVIRDLTP